MINRKIKFKLSDKEHEGVIIEMGVTTHMAQLGTNLQGATMFPATVSGYLVKYEVGKVIKYKVIIPEWIIEIGEKPKRSEYRYQRHKELLEAFCDFINENNIFMLDTAKEKIEIFLTKKYNDEQKE